MGFQRILLKAVQERELDAKKSEADEALQVLVKKVLFRFFFMMDIF